MDNWPLFLALTLALSGGIYLLSRPLPLDYKNREHRFAKLHENKDARPGFYSFDAEDKRPVPLGWQRAR